MPQYSEGFRERAVQMMMAPNAMSVAQVSRDTGVSEQPLYNWRNRFRDEGSLVLEKLVMTSRELVDLGQAFIGAQQIGQRTSIQSPSRNGRPIGTSMRGRTTVRFVENVRCDAAMIDRCSGTCVLAERATSGVSRSVSSLRMRAASASESRASS